MRTVFRFSKGGGARYISHLDLMRAMNRAIRRADVPAAYSQGFHPHIVMSFAQALGLGYLSSGEYMEITLPGDYDLNEAIERLNGVLPEGVRVTGAWALRKEFPTLMAAVSAARWRLGLAGSEYTQQFLDLLGRESVEVEKTGKNGPTQTDIRSGLYGVEAHEGGVELLLAAGSALNIRPELVAKAALGSDGAVTSIERLELYTTVNGRRVPLSEICSGGEPDVYGKDHTG